MINPAFNREKIISNFVDGKFRSPAVVLNQFHRRFRPFRIFFMPKFYDGGKRVVSIGKNVCFDDYLFTHRPFDSVTSAVNLRRDVFDDNAPAAVLWKLISHNPPPELKLLCPGTFAKKKFARSA